MRKVVFLFVGISVLGWSVAAFAAWETVGDGVDYQYFRIAADPNDVFVSRMQRSNSNCVIESSIAQGTLRTGRETVSDMAGRYDQAINYWGGSWGQRNDVVVAINGHYFDLSSGYPQSGQIHSGWFAKGYLEWSGGSGFVWKLDRTCFLGGNVTNGDVYANPKSKVFFNDGAFMDITRINSDRGTGEFILYTPQWADNTYAANNGVEVLVQLNAPNLLETQVSGTIRAVRENAGSTLIPFDHVVLSGQGTAGTDLLSHVVVGDPIAVKSRIRDWDSGNDWTNAYSGIGGHFYCVRSGTVPSEDWADNPGATARHPRTCVAFNGSYVFFIVVDGRTVESVGMTITELGNFCVNTLAADWAIAEDGGGSSTMVVNGVVKNNPSDGTERAVANGLMMVNFQPMQTSTTFSAGSPVRTTDALNVRLGPGTNYAVITTAPLGQEGTISTHPVNGVLAKGFYWWKWSYGSVEGWSVEPFLEGIGSATSAWQIY